MRPIFLISLFFFSVFSANAQKELKEIEKSIDSFKVLMSSNPQKAISFLNRANTLNQTINNDSISCRVLCNYGYYYYQVNQRSKSKEIFVKALGLAKKGNYSYMLSYVYNNLGQIASDNGDYKEAINFYMASLKIAKKNQNAIFMSNALNNLGNLFLVQKDTIKALEYYNQNVENALKNDLTQQLANGYMTLGGIYRLKESNIALEHYKKAAIIVEKSNDLNSQFIIEMCLTSICFKSKSNQKYEEGFQHIKKATAIQNILKDESMLYYIHLKLGHYYYYHNQLDLAEKNYKLAEKYSKIGIDLDVRTDVYKTLSEFYVFKKEYKQALFYTEKYRNLMDSIFSINKTKAINDIQTKYEVDKKNNRINLLTVDQKNKKNTIQFLAITGVLLLLGVFGILFFYKFKLKTQRLIATKEQKIQNQNIVRLQNEQELKRINGIVEGQELERNRLAKEIHDGIGATLAGVKLELSQINSNLNNNDIKNVEIKMSTAFQELRQVSHNLSLNFVEDNQLEKLINNLINEYHNRKEFTIEFILFPENSLNDISYTTKQHIYRIIQELLRNVSKHSNATNVTLSFTKHEDSLNMIMEDNGKGFENSSVEGIGLKNIKERIVMMNGSISVESDRGTIIIIDIPLNV